MSADLEILPNKLILVISKRCSSPMNPALTNRQLFKIIADDLVQGAKTPNSPSDVCNAIRHIILLSNQDVPDKLNMLSNSFYVYVLRHVSENLKNGFFNEAKKILDAMEQLPPETPIPTEDLLRVLRTALDVIADAMNKVRFTDIKATLKVINKLPSGIIILDLFIVAKKGRDHLVRLFNEGNAQATEIILGSMNHLPPNTIIPENDLFPVVEAGQAYIIFAINSSDFWEGDFANAEATLKVLKKVPFAHVPNDYFLNIVETGRDLIDQAIRDRDFNVAEEILEVMKELPSRTRVPEE